jgi:uncharacterized protein (DUF2336 family)
MGKEPPKGSELIGSPADAPAFAPAANAAGSGKPADRGMLLAALESLFLDAGHALDGNERALMGEVLATLVYSVEDSLRRELADRLARRTDAPHSVVDDLVRGDIEAARPLLLHSPVLNEADLVRAVDHGTIAHCLAIARRRGIPEPVTEALVATDNRDIAITLLNNRSAGISRETMARLAERSRRVRALRAPIIRRPDLPADIARAMYWWVSTAQRNRIVSRFGVSPVVIGRAGARGTAPAPRGGAASTTEDERDDDRVPRPVSPAPAEESSV